MYNIIHLVTDSFLSYESLDSQYKRNTDSSISSVKRGFYFMKTNKTMDKAWMRLILINTSL